MGVTGICWDSSGEESLWSTFKHEYYYRHVFATKAELVSPVDKWIDFYQQSKASFDYRNAQAIAYEHSLNATTQAA